MFDRAQSRLVLLKETEEVTARDILDVFRDLCSDVSQEGKKVEKLPPGDEEELVSDLCFIARMISRIYTENETLFSNGQQKSRWERVRERFQQVVKAADEAEAMETKIQDLKEETEAKEKQYEKLFELDGVKLEFDESAINAIAEKSMTRKTGARGLRAIMENTMMDLMYEIPSDETIRSCKITKEVVEGTGSAELEHGEMQPPTRRSKGGRKRNKPETA